MRIGFVCSRFFPPDGYVGGIQVFILTLAQRLQLLGHYPVVISAEPNETDCRERDDVRGIRVHRFAESQQRPRAFWRRLQHQHVVEQVVRKEKLDLVECSLDGGVLLSKRFGCPLVVRMHSSHMVCPRRKGPRLSAIDGFFERRLLTMADARVGVSNWLARTTLETAGLKHMDYRVIYNGVDTTLFSPGHPARSDHYRLLFVGRLTSGKGFPVLLDALSAVKEIHPTIRLRCIGSAPSQSRHPVQSAERHLSGLLTQMGSLVELAGWVPHEQTPDEYRRATVFVLPSQYEGQGIVVLEAMACGIPVVFMKDGVGPELITHGEDGLLCDTRDPASVASAILEALSSPDLRRSLGERARQKVLERFSLDRTTLENISLYEEMVGACR